MDSFQLPNTFRLKASRELQPLQQGELDGFCGVYSLINAIQLVSTKKLTKGELEGLFSFAIHRLSEKGDMREFTCRGIPWTTLKVIGLGLVDIASSDSCKLRLEVISRGKPERLERIRRTVFNGSALLASLYRDEHYSVIVGWTPKRAILFDSSAGHWVPLQELERALCVCIRPTNL